MSVSKIMLNALGQQDSFLIENPDFTFFKKKPSTHTNFAKSLVEIDPNCLQNDETNINFGETIDFTINNTGDLLLNVTTKFVLEDPTGDKWNNLNNNIVPETLFALIDYIEIVSNDRVLQKLTGMWMYIYYTNYVNKSNNKHLINSASASLLTRTDLIGSNIIEYTLHLPIPFWFSKNSDLALPICSLQHEKISINVKIKNFNDISLNSTQSDFVIKNIKLLCEFIELEQTEKQKFLQTPIQYLIEQVEYNGPHNINVKGKTSSRMKFKLQDSYLVKDIIWVIKEQTSNEIKNYFNFWHNNNSGEYRTDHFKDGSILLNGRVLNPRFSASYYRMVQRDQHYKSDRGYVTSNIGMNNYLDRDNIEKKNNCIYSYSFSLDPELIKSSGFLSFKKFNNVHLDLQISSLVNTKNRELLIFIKRFNIIRIKNGKLDILAN